ncbi:unnamed protein product [Fraxinus pennsylvanica]|uniref:Uncharacterized protein n=1 Tax=Fraxinus pennsylvanica TaxID=56036 RepID=A0AAD2A571_9LAMI|nr:unnamed protein product [Fraxinus pennsylvanica]
MTKQVHEKKGIALEVSDSEDSYNSTNRCHSHGRRKGLPTTKVPNFTPSMLPPTAVKYRTVKRRNRIPHRAPIELQQQQSNREIEGGIAVEGKRCGAIDGAIHFIEESLRGRWRGTQVK